MFSLDELESLFFQILEDLKEYLADLTLVGGWLAYIYTKFLWDEVHVKPVTTVDVDFGFGKVKKTYSKTLFDSLKTLDYEEHHISIGKLFPVVLYKRGKIPIEFITFPEVSNDVVEKFIGSQIHCYKIEGFNFLLKHRILIDVTAKKQKSAYRIFCPKPSAFLYQKGAGFIDRETDQAKAKDLHYMYFVLRYAPEIGNILNEVIQYKKRGYFKNIQENLNKYFENKSSQGCLMVEKEHGPDDYIENLREDIFERFGTLRELFKNR
ncbi:MAG: GSU2403 family nucleotidyltransferase fold protein [Candidatus Aminicenantes bacterium]